MTEARSKHTMSFTMEFSNIEMHPHVAAFLEVRDRLNLAATCRSGLESVLPSLTELHRTLFHERSEIKDEENLVPATTYTSLQKPNAISSSKRALAVDTKREARTQRSLPGLHELLETLADVIPPKYSNRTKIQALRSVLVASPPTTCDTVGSVTLEPIQHLHRLMCPLYLWHDLVTGRPLSNNETSTLVLHEYIGDVYCAIYLLGTVEPRLRRLFHTADSSLYMKFVHRHASLLQISLEQRQRFGILNLPYYNLTESSNDKDELVTMTLIYDDFAPLGPQFRGRDIVRTLETGLSPMNLSWIAQAHEQCRLHRPMTVRPPEVRLGL